uniref:Uncharacterized protein n=1 Tax=Glossina pallidipes TaxID=7398 RepID=A0A1B0AJI8_GLOPL
MNFVISSMTSQQVNRTSIANLSLTDPAKVYLNRKRLKSCQTLKLRLYDEKQVNALVKKKAKKNIRFYQKTAWLLPIRSKLNANGILLTNR